MAINSGVLDIGGNSVSVGNLSGTGGAILSTTAAVPAPLAVGGWKLRRRYRQRREPARFERGRQRHARPERGQRLHGTTAVSGGTLQFQGSSALPAASPINLQYGVLQIRNDGSGSRRHDRCGENNITLSLETFADVIAVGNLATSNSGNTVAFGVLSNGTTANALDGTINFTAANGYLQSYTGLELPGWDGASAPL